MLTSSGRNLQRNFGVVNCVCPYLSSRESNDGAVLVLVLLEFLGVNALLVEDGAVPLNHTSAHGTGTVKVASGVQTHITKT